MSRNRFGGDDDVQADQHEIEFSRNKPKSNSTSSSLSSKVLRSIISGNSQKHAYQLINNEDEDEVEEQSATLLNQTDNEHRPTQDSIELSSKSSFASHDVRTFERLHERTLSPVKQRRNKPHFKPYYDDERKSRPKFSDHIVREIGPEDTLQNISLKSGCSVSELKRANNIMNDQEFYGLKYIKIPIKRYGLLSEVLVHHSRSSEPDVQRKERDLLTGEEDLLFDAGSCSNSEQLTINVGIRQTFNRDHNHGDVKQFIRNLDKDLEEIRNKVQNATTVTGSSSPIDNYFTRESNVTKSKCDQVRLQS